MECNWGVLGAGFIANRAMIPAIQHSSQARVLAVASRDEQRGQEAAQGYSIERVYSDYEALLDDPDVQVVYIALPNHLHYEWAIRAAHAGKHVLCEKPLARTIVYTNSKGEPWSSRVSDVLMHVVLHGGYHRGQIAADLREAGFTPAYTDYIEAVRRGWV